jgi:hypothetical protein
MFGNRPKSLDYWGNYSLGLSGSGGRFNNHIHSTHYQRDSVNLHRRQFAES